MEFNNQTDNGVNGSGTSGEAAASGRCAVPEQAVLGSHPTIARRRTYGKRRWSKEDYSVLMECYLRAKSEGGRGVGGRMLIHWENKGLLELTENKLMNQVRMIQRRGWLTSVEVEEIQRKIDMEANVVNQRATEDTLRVEELTEDIMERAESEIEMEDTNEIVDTEELTETRTIDAVMGESVIPEGLEEEQRNILLRLKEILNNPDCIKPLNLRHINNGKILVETKKVDAVLDHITTTNITDY